MAFGISRDILYNRGIIIISDADLTGTIPYPAGSILIRCRHRGHRYSRKVI